jgi:hypothetical protein
VKLEKTVKGRITTVRHWKKLAVTSSRGGKRTGEVSIKLTKTAKLLGAS